MRVFGELSFHILITCLTFFIVAKKTSQREFEQRGTGTTQNEHPFSSNEETSVEEEGTSELEAIIFFRTLFHPPPPRITKINFEQKLNHFDTSDDRTWIQRAYFDDQYEDVNGPVLLKIGQLKPIHRNELEDPTMVYLAKNLNAVLYILEHRFFGESVPTELTTKNLELLCTTEQALVDIKRFIEDSDHNHKPWIVFGAGYGGTLAAWFRLKYPYHALSALAFSAPLRGMSKENETYSILDNLEENVKKTLIVAFQQLQKAIISKKFDELKNKFNMCSSLNSGNLKDNVNFLNWKLINHLSDVVEKSNMDMMKILTDRSVVNPLDILATVIKGFYKGNCMCVDYNEAIKKYKNVNIKYEYQIDYPMSLKSGLGTRPHFYKRCAEYGFFETSEDGKYTFGVIITLDFYTRMCQNTFDINFNPRRLMRAINAMNNYYGGRNIPTTNLIYMIPNNEFWKSIGMVESRNNKLIIIDYEADDVRFMKSLYDSIIYNLNEWTKNVSEVSSDE